MSDDIAAILVLVGAALAMPFLASGSSQPVPIPKYITVTVPTSVP